MICPNCGKEIAENVKFCTNCGYNVKNFDEKMAKLNMDSGLELGVFIKIGITIAIIAIMAFIFKN